LIPAGTRSPDRVLLLSLAAAGCHTGHLCRRQRTLRCVSLHAAPYLETLDESPASLRLRSEFRPGVGPLDDVLGEWPSLCIRRAPRSERTPTRVAQATFGRVRAHCLWFHAKCCGQLPDRLAFEHFAVVYHVRFGTHYSSSQVMKYTMANSQAARTLAPATLTAMYSTEINMMIPFLSPIHFGGLRRHFWGQARVIRIPVVLEFAGFGGRHPRFHSPVISDFRTNP